MLVVNSAMPEDLAYDITRLLFEKQPELQRSIPKRATSPRDGAGRLAGAVLIPARCASIGRQGQSVPLR